jgi:Flp pilus assembly protein TadG
LHLSERLAKASIGRRMTHSDPHQRSRGLAFTEFALLLPVVFVLFIGVLDFGRVFYAAMAVSNAARAGVQYGAQDNARSGDFAGMRSAANAAGDATGIGGFATPDACRYCKCADGSGSCNSCTDGSDGCSSTSACLTTCPADAPQVYVSVTAHKTFTTLFPYPGIPRTTTLNRLAVMRVQ